FEVSLALVSEAHGWEVEVYRWSAYGGASLEIDESRSSESVTIPFSSTLPTGRYRFRARVDPRNLVTEANEYNNLMTSAGTFQVTNPQLP
ncbi:MAG: CARDB domain-containing protein, partial [Armatimonadota bacterium]